MAPGPVRRNGATEQTPASSTGRYEARERQQTAPRASSPSCGSLGGLLDGGKATAARIDVDGWLGFHGEAGKARATRVWGNGYTGGENRLKRG
jgi:hypothetical protein